MGKGERGRGRRRETGGRPDERERASSRGLDDGGPGTASSCCCFPTKTVNSDTPERNGTVRGTTRRVSPPPSGTPTPEGARAADSRYAILLEKKGVEEGELPPLELKHGRLPAKLVQDIQDGLGDRCTVEPKAVPAMWMGPTDTMSVTWKNSSRETMEIHEGDYIGLFELHDAEEEWERERGDAAGAEEPAASPTGETTSATPSSGRPVTTMKIGVGGGEAQQRADGAAPAGAGEQRCPTERASALGDSIGSQVAARYEDESDDERWGTGRIFFQVR